MADSYDDEYIPKATKKSSKKEESI